MISDGSKRGTGQPVPPKASIQKLPKRCFDEGALFPIMWMMRMMFSL